MYPDRKIITHGLEQVVEQVLLDSIAGQLIKIVIDISPVEHQDDKRQLHIHPLSPQRCRESAELVYERH